MARRQRHLVDVGGIPRGDDQAAGIRIAPDHVDHIGDLVDGAAVMRRPGAPLPSVDRTEVAVSSAHSSQIRTPWSLRYLMLVSPARNQSSSWTIDLACSFLVVVSGKAVGEIEAHLMAEHGQGAGAGAVALLDPAGEQSHVPSVRDIAAWARPNLRDSLRRQD